MHLWRVRDPRLIPLLGLFLMMAAAHSLEWWHRWRNGFEMAAAACGLALLPMLKGHARDAAPPRS